MDGQQRGGGSGSVRRRQVVVPTASGGRAECEGGTNFEEMCHAGVSHQIGGQRRWFW
jgi:hypothetical protein